MTPTGALQTRSIFTHGYVAGGYKNGTAWRSVNKTWHSNDVTIYCGEQMDIAVAYGGGTFSDYYGYLHGVGGGYDTDSTHTTSYNLGSGVLRVVSASSSGANPGGPFGYTGNNPNGDGQGIVYGSSASDGAGGGGITSSTAGYGTWELSVARTYFAGTQNQTGQVGYITGGSQSTVTDKFNFPTEIMYTTTSNGSTAASQATGAGGATIMWWSFAGQNRQMAFSNDTWAAWSPGTTAAPDGICKMLTTKLGYHYVGTGNNVTIPMMKWSDSTGSSITTALNKPSAQGEENMEMGQNWGYCLGAYNGQQNNYSFKLNYTNDAFTVMGTATQPKGHVGLSSGCCSSAAASVVMNTIG
jgi:hypothetical protein